MSKRRLLRDLLNRGVPIEEAWGPAGYSSVSSARRAALPPARPRGPGLIARRIALCAEMGMTRRQTADHLGCSRSTIAKACKRWIIRFASGRRSAAQTSALRAAIRAGYAAGMTPTEIAQQQGVTKTMVSVLASQMGGAGALRGGPTLTPSHRHGLPPVPPELLDEYRFLTKRKGIPAREARTMLGIPTEEKSND